MKKRFPLGKLCVLLITLLFSFNTQAADVKICAENELVGIAAEGEGTACSEFFDCDGNYVGFLNTNIGSYGIIKVEKNTLTTVCEDKNISVYAYDTPIRKVAEYPSRNMGITICKTGYVIGDCGNQKISLYSMDGTCLYTTEAYFEGYENEGYIYMDGVSLADTPSGYYLAYMDLRSVEDTGYPYRIMGITKDGSVQTELIGGYADTEWGGWELPELRTVGDYLVIDGITYSYSGECVLQDTVCTYQPEDIYNFNAKPNGILERGYITDGIESYILYDENLTEVKHGEVTGELGSILYEVLENPWQKEPLSDLTSLCYVSSEQLNGEICSGFIAYCGPSYSTVYMLKENVEGWIPYARVNDGAYVFLNGETRFLPLGDEEELSAVNDYLYLTRDNADGWAQKIHRMDTGEVLIREEGSFLCLEKDFVAGHLSWESGRDENIIEIDRDTYEVNYRKVYGMTYPWSDNCLVVKRSIYRGITDKDGNWIVKIINGGLD